MTDSEVINLLFKYRARLKQQYEEPGWNFWVLLASLASLIWLILELLESQKFEYYNSINLFFSFVTIEFSFLFMRNSVKKTKYLTSKNVTIHSLPLIFFITLVFGWAIIHINWFTSLNFMFKINASLFFGVLLLATPGAYFLLNTSNLPLPVVPDNPIGKWFKRGLFLLGLSTLIGLITSYNRWPDILTIRSSLIFLAVYYVLCNLLRNYKPETLIQQIDTIIDDLTFKKISSEAAIDNLRLIVFGLEFKDVISPTINSHLDLDKKFHEKCLSIENLLSEFKTSNETVQDAIMDSIEKKLTELEDLSGHLKKNTLKLAAYLSNVSRIDKNSSDPSRLLTKLTNQSIAQKDKINQIKTQIKDIKDIVFNK